MRQYFISGSRAANRWDRPDNYTLPPGRTAHNPSSAGGGDPAYCAGFSAFAHRECRVHPLLRDDLLNWPAHVDLQELVAGHLQFARVEAELAQHGGVDVGDVMPVLDGVEAQFVSGAVGDA